MGRGGAEGAAGHALHHRVLPHGGAAADGGAGPVHAAAAEPAGGLRPHLGFSLLQVIEEIEEIMQDSSDVEVEHRASRPGVSTMSAAPGGPGFEKGELERGVEVAAAGVPPSVRFGG